MPKINLIKRKWLEQHKLHACLRQADFLMKKESLMRNNDDDDNNDVDDCSFPQDCDHPPSTLASPYSMSLDTITRHHHRSPTSPPPPPKKNKDGNKNASNVRCTDGLSSTPRFQPLVRKISNHSDDDTSCAVNDDTNRAVTPSSEDLKCTEAMREPAIKSLEMKLTQGLTVIVPAGGTLGLYLEDDTDVDNAGEGGGTVVKDVRLSSVLIKQVYPGDRIVSIDGQDVSQMTTSEISTLLALWNSDLDRELVIKPSLASTVPFTNVASHQPSQKIHSISIYEGVKRHITANKMTYNEVRVLLQQPGLSKVKQHVAQWYASTPIMSSIYQSGFDIPAASDQPKKKRRRLCFQEPVPSDEKGEY